MTKYLDKRVRLILMDFTTSDKSTEKASKEILSICCDEAVDAVDKGMATPNGKTTGKSVYREVAKQLITKRLKG